MEILDILRKFSIFTNASKMSLFFPIFSSTIFSRFRGPREILNNGVNFTDSFIPFKNIQKQ